MDNCILIDWFAVTFRGGDGHSDWDIYEIIDFLQFNKEIHWEERPGRYLYKNRLSFGNIHIYYNNLKKDADYPLLELTGQGCREFETFSDLGLTKLLEIVTLKPNMFHISRIDIAYDDHTGILDITKIVSDHHNGNFICIASNGYDQCSYKGTLKGFSSFFGSKSSDIYLRIYDKAIERKYTDGRHWIRCELSLKQDRAVQFLKDPHSLGVKFRGVIHKYLRFVSPSKTDINKRRWKMRKYWEKFLDGAEKISLFSKKDIDYNLSFLHKYVFGQAGNSIYTYINCVGLTAFLEELLDSADNKKVRKLNTKQKYLIQQCKFMCDSNEKITETTIEDLEKKYDYNSDECKLVVKQFNEDYSEFSSIFDEDGEYLALKL